MYSIRGVSFWKNIQRVEALNYFLLKAPYQMFYRVYTSPLLNLTTSIFRSSRSQMFFKIGVLKNFAIFIAKHLSCSLFLIKLQKILQHRLFPVKFTKFLKTPFFIEHLGQLHLNFALMIREDFIKISWIFACQKNFLLFYYIIIIIFLNKQDRKKLCFCLVCQSNTNIGLGGKFVSAGAVFEKQH